MTSIQDQPQAVDFVVPDGFSETYMEQAQASAQMIFVGRPTANSNGCCSYLISSDGVRTYLPNTVRLFLSSLSITTVEYEDQMYQAQDKLIVNFTSVGGDSFCFRMGLLSYAASSFVLACTHLNSVALTGELELTWVSKGAATFARVASPVNGGYTSVQLPKQALGYKLDYDQMQDALTFINQSIQTGDAVPPRFFGEPQEEEQAPPELDSVLEELRAPTKARRKSTKKTAEALTPA